MKIFLLFIMAVIFISGCVSEQQVAETPKAPENKTITPETPKVINESVTNITADNKTVTPGVNESTNDTNITITPKAPEKNITFYKKLLPPKKGAYHGAFPDFGGEEDEVTSKKISDFESLAGKPIVWAYFSDNWDQGISFPEADVLTVHQAGAVPFIRLMPRSDFEGGGPDSVYTMQRIIDGDFDDDLEQWAKEAKKTNIPLIIEFGTEVNGDWFPWNGKWNGGKTSNNYGDTSLPDGPERFRDAYRHIIDIFNEQGLENVTWVFHVDAQGSPEESWNSMAAYYPGDDYIDWIGISVYGPGEPGEDWETFNEILDDVYSEFSTISTKKPLAILEFGVVDDPATGDKATWIQDALGSIKKDRYPRIKAVSYWHESWENEDGSTSDMKIDSSPKALKAYKEGIADSYFVANASFSS
jgi:hypothetical protein